MRKYLGERRGRKQNETCVFSMVSLMVFIIPGMLEALTYKGYK